MAVRRAHGIDISRHQAKLIPPPENKADIDFVILKASQATWPDDKFSTHYDSASKFPIRGAYHYYQALSTEYSRLLPENNRSGKAKGGKPKEEVAKVLSGGTWLLVPKSRVQILKKQGTDWKDQADFFLKQVHDKDIHFYALDIENGPDPNTYIGYDRNIFTLRDVNNMKAWIDYVKKETGKPVLLYTNMDVYQNRLSKLDPMNRILGEIDFWIARYFDETPDRDTANPRIPGVENWRLWQYSADGNNKGPEYGVAEKIPNQVKQSAVDLNVYNGTLEDMRRWLNIDGIRPASPVQTGEVAEETGMTRVEKLAEDGSSLEDLLANLDKLKSAGVVPGLRINLSLDVSDPAAVENLVASFKKAGISPEVTINLQVGLGAGSVSHRGGQERQAGGSKDGEEKDARVGGSADPATRVAEKDDPAKNQAEDRLKDSFLVEVSEKVAKVQSFKRRDKNNKPIMLPHDRADKKPERIQLPEGTRLRVSSNHKESDIDSGDGVIHGSGAGAGAQSSEHLYYYIVDCPYDRDAEGLFVKLSEVRSV